MSRNKIRIFKDLTDKNVNFEIVRDPDMRTSSGSSGYLS
jgi:hypothetical protein